VSGLAAPAPGAFLSGFDPAHAADVASWVRSDRELLWLAPATAPPITVEKVLNWGKERRRRQLYWDKAAAGPVGYAELNDMPEHADRFWIGHFIIDPRFRGRGLGVAFVRALLVRAFMEFVASEVSLVVFPDNLGAIRCYEEAGMVALGQERKHFEATSRDHVFLRMGIHRTRFTRLAAAGRFPAQPLPFVERPPDGGLLQPG
jgi:RimJ/RimL family protein N-acetyltransferase